MMWQVLGRAKAHTPVGPFVTQLDGRAETRTANCVPAACGCAPASTTPLLSAALHWAA